MTHIWAATSLMALGLMAPNLMVLGVTVPEPETSVAAEQAKQNEEKRGVGMDQIIPYEIDLRPKSAEPNQIDAIRLKSGKNATVSQLPDDIEIIDPDSKGPEQAIVRETDSPEARLYSQVAEVWETIRARGQQPTPELIAREIGPDALASFLDQNPGSENIFGKDSDNLPLPGLGDLELPDGSGAIILPPDGGG